MITKDKLKALLTYFGFTENKGIFKKDYQQGASIEVNTISQKENIHLRRNLLKDLLFIETQLSISAQTRTLYALCVFICYLKKVTNQSI